MIIKSFTNFINEELQKVVSDQSGSGRTKFIDTIWDDPQNPKSASSGILLKKQLKDKEFDDLKKYLSTTPDYIIKDLIKNDKLSKFKVTLNNLQFLKDRAKEGDLYCEYCGKGPLIIYDFNPDEVASTISDPKYRFNAKFNAKDGATADHKQPQSKGGDKLDYNNLSVSCEKCNKEKGNMSWEDWSKRIKNRKVTESKNIDSNDADDIDHIEDVLVGLKDFGLNIHVLKLSKNEYNYQLIIQGKEFIDFESFGEFSIELNNCIKSISSFVKDYKIDEFEISNSTVDNDGDTYYTEKLNIYIYIKFNLKD